MNDDFTDGIIEGLRMALILVKRTPATVRLSLDMAYDSILSDIDKINELRSSNASQDNTKEVN
jgi:hypothetical protein